MKGVSPLVAVVLIIAISVLLTGIIFGWLKGFTTFQTEEISNRTEDLTACSGSSIRIDDVYLDFTSNKSRITVRNAGQLAEKIISAELLNNNGQNVSFQNQTVAIGKGEIKTIEFAINGTIQGCGQFSQVKVTTLCSSNSYKRKPVNCP